MPRIILSPIRPMVLPALTAFCLLAMAVSSSQAHPDKISPVLGRMLPGSDLQEKQRCWIFFGDKGSETSPPRWDPRAWSRRAKVGRAVSYGDLPVNRSYIDRVAATGAKVRTVSRWLNAVSVEADAAAVAAIAALTEVRSIEPVAVFRRPSDQEQIGQALSKEIPPLDHGYADEQIRLMRIHELHQRGYTGSGVRLCLIDTGFDREHETLRRIRVLAERDFQRADDFVTSFEPEQDSTRIQTWHGTAMLSIIGAYKPGVLVGSAYNCDFILAKTEHLHADNEPDFYQEEDWWVAALEWADSLGADIVSSSLGYRQWSDHLPYTYPDMNGSTAKCTMAADSAVQRGILIVNALGNVNTNNRPDTCLLAPADARGILSVGGVWASSKQWANPRQGSGAVAGPAADSIRISKIGSGDSAWIRRIKPEVASSWQNSFAYNEPDSLGNFTIIKSSVGTSGATALTAGLCALIIQAHPSWGPAQVIEALKASGSNRACVEAYYTAPESLATTLGTWPFYNPAFSNIANGSRLYRYNGISYDLYDVYRVGWGVPDGVVALNYTPPEVVLPDKDELYDPYPNPARASDGGVFLPFFLTRDSYRVAIYIYSLDGRLIRLLDLGQKLAGDYPGLIDRIRNRSSGREAAYWDLKDDRGRPVPSGLYLTLLSTGWGQSLRKVMVVR